MVQAKEISKFPANRRDLALVVADNVPAGDIIDACKQAGGEKLTQVNLFDVYQGIGVASGHKSLSLIHISMMVASSVHGQTGTTFV